MTDEKLRWFLELGKDPDAHIKAIASSSTPLLAEAN
jgi:hypothetical protein